MTLVEMLVVLAVIGTAAGMVVLSVGARDVAAAQTEANRLADRFRLAVDEALIGNGPVGLQMDARGYAFNAAGASSEDWGARHDLPRGVALIASQSRMLVDPDGAAAPVAVTLRDGRQAFTVVFDGLNAEVQPLVTGAGS